MVASLARGAAVLAAGATLIGLGFLACGSDDEKGPELSPNPIGQAPEPYFRNLEADLVASCGGTNGRCHVNGIFQNEPRWLGRPDAYVSIRKYRCILPAK